MSSSFQVRHGEFTVPPELLEDGREWELSRLFAQQLPHGCTSIKRTTTRGVTMVRWLVVRFLGWYDDAGNGPSYNTTPGALSGSMSSTVALSTSTSPSGA